MRLEGFSDHVENVTDYTRILALNPWALPALAIDGKVVVAGRIATLTEIRQLIVPTLSETNAPDSPSISKGDCS